MKPIHTLILIFLSSMLCVTAKAQSSSKPEVVMVPGGTYSMGSNERDQNPIHEVQVDSFQIGKHEITVKQYRTYSTQTGTQMPEEPG